MKNRKGARTKKDIPIEVLALLNKGELSSVNLTEWLAIDQKLLVSNVLLALDRKDYISIVLGNIDKLKKPTVNSVNQCIGYTLFDISKERGDIELFGLLKTHTSDLVRCWAAYFVGFNDSLRIDEKLEAIKYFAGDDHFGVREIAWMSVRESITNHLEESIKLLLEWTHSENANIRRFATESTRPRGVWCKHIEVLKEQPELAVCLLEELKDDSSKYVRDSVSNWLNDAAKTKPTFVIDLCNLWLCNDPLNKNLMGTIKKAKRNLQ
ncbi:DNA alkylation repair protein [Myroides pelagicus]|uniref:DNA alkylation repair protein n=1 Tax=Myroides pelagicus TaxID=270914 RepID=A0A7K1GQY6_9FLAO|nr:DNA alkylation repair protein [Myroides pelagicus]MEC4114643.1 DNA alkylation repair protein [Myroides pelagicus]MTH30723.1 DNA alkylation repair protein [Myroides pelagicus]